MREIPGTTKARICTEISNSKRSQNLVERLLIRDTRFLRMKQTNRHLKLLLSIGGWTFSSHFVAVSTPQGRNNFVRSAMRILEDVGLDGLDIDWEYPKNDQEAWQYVQLLGELRQALDARGHAMQSRHWLSIAAPCGEQMRTLRVAEMDRKYL